MGEKLRKQPKASNRSQSRLFISKNWKQQQDLYQSRSSLFKFGSANGTKWMDISIDPPAPLYLWCFLNNTHFLPSKKKNICLTIGFVDWIWIDRWWMCLLHYIIGIIWRILWMGRSSWWTPLHHVFQFVLQMGEKLRKQPKASNSSQSRCHQKR